MPGKAADGYITYSTKLDNAQLEKDLAKSTKKVEQLEKKAQSNSAKRLPLAEQTKKLGAELDAAKMKLAELQEEAKRVDLALAGDFSYDPASIQAYSDATIRKPQIEKEMKAAEKAVDQLQKKFDDADDKLLAFDKKAQKVEQDLNDAKEKAGDLAAELSRPVTAGERMSEAVSKAEGKIDKFAHRVAGLAKRVFVFTIITRAFGAIRDLMGKYITANSEATQAIAQLRGALLTLAQPLLNVIIPAFTAFINIVTRVAAAVANLVSLLFGKSIKQSKKAAESMYNEAEAIEAAGSAAEDAAGSLAAFDEINQLSDNSGGGGAAANSPNFEFDTSTMEADMDKLLGWIKLIGAALLAWKLSDTFMGGLKMFVGLILAINGAIELAKGAWDAWQNGMNWDNLLQMLGGAALLAGGLWIAFGKVGGAIGLIVGGLALLVTSFHDAMENGWNLQNVLGAIAGLLMGGLGIALLTGSWIPLLIAGIGAALLALTIATGHGEELIEGVRKVCQGFVDFIAGIFTGDIDRALAGVSQIFEGLGQAVDAVIDGLRDTFLSFLDWLDAQTGGRFHNIIEGAKNFVRGFFDTSKEILGNLLSAVKQIFDGIVKFVAGVFTNDWDLAWEGVKDIFKGAWNSMVALLEGAINIIIKGLNYLIRQMNKIKFDVPGWVPGVGGKSVGINIPSINPASIPRLATGTVVPPNREFMALLGDNKTEHEVVSPLSVIKQAMAEVLAESGGGEQVFKFYFRGREMAVEVVKEINNMTREAGHSVIRT